MSLGEKIALARIAKGWNQSNLAKALDVEPPTVSRWEGNLVVPKPRRMVLIAKALGKPIEWFQETPLGLNDVEKRLEALESKRERLTPLELELVEAFRAAGSGRGLVTLIQNAALTPLEKKQRRRSR